MMWTNVKYPNNIEIQMGQGMPNSLALSKSTSAKIKVLQSTTEKSQIYIYKKVLQSDVTEGGFLVKLVKREWGRSGKK